jgi:hypothetical protein
MSFFLPPFFPENVASVVGGLIECVCVATDGNTTTVCLSLSQSIIHHQHERELNRGWRREKGSHSRDDDDDPQILFFDTIQPPLHTKRVVGGGVLRYTLVSILIDISGMSEFIFCFGKNGSVQQTSGCRLDF